MWIFLKFCPWGPAYPLWILQHRLYCFFLHCERVPVPSSWKPVSGTNLHDIVVVGWGVGLEETGVMQSMFGFQEHLSTGSWLMNSPVSLPTKAHKHKTFMDWLMRLLYSSGVSGHEAHLRYDTKLMPGYGMICAFEPVIPQRTQTPSQTLHFQELYSFNCVK